MSCPTCDHTMVVLATENGFTFRLCPRCGTVSRTGGTMPETYVPKLVDRCRELWKVADNSTAAELHRLGIREAVYPPGDST